MSYPVDTPPEEAGAYVVGDGKAFGRNETEAGIRAKLRNPGIAGFERGQSSLWGGSGFLGTLISGLTQGHHRDLLGGGKYFADIRDGQLDLNERADLLSPLLDYGSAYMDKTTPNVSGQVLPFNKQIGPMHGCTLDPAGGIVLGDRGLWDVRCQLWFDFIIANTANIQWDIRVLRPDNSIFSVTSARMDSGDPVSMTNITSVVVPEPGYKVVAAIVNLANGRGILGGPNRNRLTVQHISRDTTTGNTGQS